MKNTVYPVGYTVFQFVKEVFCIGGAQGSPV